MLARAVLALALLAASAQAQPVRDVAFEGRAQVGRFERPARLHVGCYAPRGRINNLNIEFDLPDAIALAPVFDVIPFEGPDGAGAPSLLQAEAGDVKAEMRFHAGGWFGSRGGPASTFTFGRAFTPQDRGALPRLQAVLQVLGTGAGRLTWTVQNGVRQEAPVVASFELAEEDGVRLRRQVQPCLERRAQP